MLAGTRVLVAVIALLLPPALAVGDVEKSTESRSAVIADLAQQIRDQYLFPEAGSELIARLEAKAREGGYDAAPSPKAFAEALTEDLRTWSDDAHFFVYYAGIPPDGPPPGFGSPFATVKRLDGMVILEEIHKLSGRKKAIETMEGLGAAEALIFDLRECTGGEKITVQLVASYLFDKRVHLATYHERGQKPVEGWTLRKVPGKRLPEAAVYVLTSERTASGCEALAYYLKHHGRATIVGEKTMGAAHSVGTFDLAHQFRAFIPRERPISPVTGSNWQGTGVLPDLEAAAGDALAEALRLAGENGS